VTPANILNLSGGLLNFGKEKAENRKISYNNMISSPRGDFCIFTSVEGENFIFIQRAKAIENLAKLKRVINALKFTEVLNEEERSVVKFICTSSVGTFLLSFDMDVRELNSAKQNAIISVIEVASADQSFVSNDGFNVVVLGTATSLYLFSGRDQIPAILERDLPKDRRNFMLASGTGKDCIVSVFINERGVQSLVYFDGLKILFVKVPSKVLCIL